MPCLLRKAAHSGVWRKENDLVEHTYVLKQSAMKYQVLDDPNVVDLKAFNSILSLVLPPFLSKSNQHRLVSYASLNTLKL